MNGLGIGAVTLLVVVVVVRIFLHRWLMSRYRAGQISGRAAGWIYAAAATAPYLVLALVVAVTAIEDLWIVILLLVVTLPVMIVPYVAMFRYPRDK